jgi:branched-chain amino acid transport system substrate-binding protein
MNDATRAWSKRFAENHNGNMPTMIHAGVYSSLLHYFKAVEALGNTDSKAVVAKMKELPASDELFGEGEVRADGRKTHKMYLFEVKTPDESKGAWDYYKLVTEIPADEAVRPLADGGCELVK